MPAGRALKPEMIPGILTTLALPAAGMSVGGTQFAHRAPPSRTVGIGCGVALTTGTEIVRSVDIPASAPTGGSSPKSALTPRVPARSTKTIASAVPIVRQPRADQKLAIASAVP